MPDIEPANTTEPATQPVVVFKCPLKAKVDSLNLLMTELGLSYLIRKQIMEHFEK